MTVHLLPADAQTDAGDHVKVEEYRFTPDGPIHMTLTYGTTDSNGDFVPQTNGKQRSVAVSDRSGFDAASSKADSAPGQKKAAKKHFESDVLNWLDTKDGQAGHPDGWPRFS